MTSHLWTYSEAQHRPLVAVECREAEGSVLPGIRPNLGCQRFELAPRDANGQRWPEWIAERNYNVFFRDIPELDIMFLDNVVNPGVTAGLESRRQGRAYEQVLPSSPPTTPGTSPSGTASGNCSESIAGRQPPTTTSAIRNGKASWTADFWRASWAEIWSTETRAGWSAAMERYRAVMRNTRAAADRRLQRSRQSR